MAIIKNLVTGVEQEVNNADVIKMCKSDTEHYTVTEKAKRTTAKPKSQKE